MSDPFVDLRLFRAAIANSEVEVNPWLRSEDRAFFYVAIITPVIHYAWVASKSM